MPAAQNDMTIGIQNGFPGTDGRKILNVVKKCPILEEKSVLLWSTVMWLYKFM
jgi:hypothetical protein